ncbi:hypothetical protein H696_00714 [Fonticula alba]|uniref:Uncharacterized protein n=1 Tax=Fonticula alba TaxID=691883 RepID=A0A058ZGS7_FONAL|nr:hypothetical protein H696_00714 [Fonticula alba]KCV73171.1 hypothetical protein H696_00714 [Fonticula alba]|eukprot:XP_009492872.1 hypothetical protein H696_00714 [Fonticula alba]
MCWDPVAGTVLAIGPLHPSGLLRVHGCLCARMAGTSAGAWQQRALARMKDAAIPLAGDFPKRGAASAPPARRPSGARGTTSLSAMPVVQSQISVTRPTGASPATDVGTMVARHMVAHERAHRANLQQHAKLHWASQQLPFHPEWRSVRAWFGPEPAAYWHDSDTCPVPQGPGAYAECAAMHRRHGADADTLPGALASLTWWRRILWGPTYTSEELANQLAGRQPVTSTFFDYDREMSACRVDPHLEVQRPAGIGKSTLVTPAERPAAARIRPDQMRPARVLDYSQSNMSDRLRGDIRRADREDRQLAGTPVAPSPGPQQLALNFLKRLIWGGSVRPMDGGQALMKGPTVEQIRNGFSRNDIPLAFLQPGPMDRRAWRLPTGIGVNLARHVGNSIGLTRMVHTVGEAIERGDRLLSQVAQGAGSTVSDTLQTVAHHVVTEAADAAVQKLHGVGSSAARLAKTPALVDAQRRTAATAEQAIRSAEKGARQVTEQVRGQARWAADAVASTLAGAPAAAERLRSQTGQAVSHLQKEGAALVEQLQKDGSVLVDKLQKEGAAKYNQLVKDGSATVNQLVKEGTATYQKLQQEGASRVKKLRQEGAATADRLQKAGTAKYNQMVKDSAAQLAKLQKDGAAVVSKLQKDGTAKYNQLVQDGSMIADKLQKEGAATYKKLVKDGSAALTHLQKEGTAKYNQIVKDGTAIANKLQKDGTAAVNKLQKEGTAMVNKLQKDGTTKYKQLVKDGSATYQKLQKEGAASYKKLRKEGTATVNRLRKDGTAMVNQLQKTGTAKYNQMVKDSAAQLARLQKEGAATAKRLRQEGAAAVDSLKKNSPAALTALGKEGAAKLAQLQKEGTATYNKLKEGAAKLTQLQKDGSALVTQLQKDATVAAEQARRQADLLQKEARRGAERLRAAALQKQRELTIGGRRLLSRLGFEGALQRAQLLATALRTPGGVQRLYAQARAAVAGLQVPPFDAMLTVAGRAARAVQHQWATAARALPGAVARLEARIAATWAQLGKRLGAMAGRPAADFFRRFGQALGDAYHLGKGALGAGARAVRAAGAWLRPWVREYAQLTRGIVRQIQQEFQQRGLYRALTMARDKVRAAAGRLRARIPATVALARAHVQRAWARRGEWTAPLAAFLADSTLTRRMTLWLANLPARAGRLTGQSLRLAGQALRLAGKSAVWSRDRLAEATSTIFSMSPGDIIPAALRRRASGEDVQYILPPGKEALYTTGRRGNLSSAARNAGLALDVGGRSILNTVREYVCDEDQNRLRHMSTSPSRNPFDMSTPIQRPGYWSQAARMLSTVLSA